MSCTGLVAPPILPNQLFTPTPTQLSEDTKSVLDYTDLSCVVRSATKKSSPNKRFNGSSCRNNNSRTSQGQNNQSRDGKTSSGETQVTSQRSRSSSGVSQSTNKFGGNKSFHHRPSTQYRQ